MQWTHVWKFKRLNSPLLILPCAIIGVNPIALIYATSAYHVSNMVIHKWTHTYKLLFAFSAVTAIEKRIPRLARMKCRLPRRGRQSWLVSGREEESSNFFAIWWAFRRDQRFNINCNWIARFSDVCSGNSYRGWPTDNMMKKISAFPFITHFALARCNIAIPYRDSYLDASKP